MLGLIHGAVAGPVRDAGRGGQQWTQLLPAAAPTGQLDAVSETTAFGGQDATDASWTGWLVVFTTSGSQQIMAASGRLLAVSPPAGNVQLIGSGTGFAWAPEPGQVFASVMELYRTTDNGRTWQRYQFRLPAAEDASTAVLLAFSDTRHGWVVQGSATLHTSDGGRTWQNV